jgi:hypothetical protein
VIRIYFKRKGEFAMASDFIDYTAPSLQGTFPKLPKDLPHGFISPPEKVRELIEKERTKHPPEVFTPKNVQMLLNEWTLQYYFDYLCHDVLYRPTPEGPEVLAVGLDEMQAFTKDMPLEDQLQFKIWMPS